MQAAKEAIITWKALVKDEAIDSRILELISKQLPPSNRQDRKYAK